MTNSDTPRVNAIAQPFSSRVAYVAMADLARELERENAELLEALKRWGTSCMVNDEIQRCGNCVGCTSYAAIAKAEGK